MVPEESSGAGFGEGDVVPSGEDVAVGAFVEDGDDATAEGGGYGEGKEGVFDDDDGYREGSPGVGLADLEVGVCAGRGGAWGQGDGLDDGGGDFSDVEVDSRGEGRRLVRHGVVLGDLGSWGALAGWSCHNDSVRLGSLRVTFRRTVLSASSFAWATFKWFLVPMGMLGLGYAVIGPRIDDVPGLESRAEAVKGLVGSAQAALPSEPVDVPAPKSRFEGVKLDIGFVKDDGRRREQQASDRARREREQRRASYFTPESQTGASGGEVEPPPSTGEDTTLGDEPSGAAPLDGGAAETGGW